MKSILLALLLLVPSLRAADMTGPVTLSYTGQTITLPAVYGTVAAIQLTAITTTVGVQLEGSLDGTNWVALLAVKAGTATTSLTATANGIYQASAAGFKSVRLKVFYLVNGTCSGTVSFGPGAPAIIPSIAVTPVP